jgi:hypothetical protein
MRVLGEERTRLRSRRAQLAATAARDEEVQAVLGLQML